MPSANEMTIGGMTVDINKPCEVLTALRKAQIQVATGETVALTRFGEDEVRFSPASSGALKELITHYERQCGASQGRRVRSARAVRWRF